MCHYINQLVYMGELSDFPEATAFVPMNFKFTKQNITHVWSLIPHNCRHWGIGHMAATAIGKKMSRLVSCAAGLAQRQILNDFCRPHACVSSILEMRIRPGLPGGSFLFTTLALVATKSLKK